MEVKDNLETCKNKSEILFKEILEFIKKRKATNMISYMALTDLFINFGFLCFTKEQIISNLKLITKALEDFNPTPILSEEDNNEKSNHSSPTNL